MQPPANRTVGQEIRGIIVFVALIWGVFLIGLVLPFDLHDFGLTPRTTDGLVGIVAMPFLHADLQHVLGNTVPLVVLLALLAGSRARSWAVVAALIVIGGALLWLFGRNARHIGASGLIFGLIAFLVVDGLRQRRFVPLLVALGVAFLYGGTLLSGVVPQFHSNVSWDGHLCGAVAGAITAYLLTRERVADLQSPRI